MFRRKPISYYWLLGTTTVLLLFGVIMIFSASSVIAYTKEGDSYYYLKRQLLWAFLGVISMSLLARYDYHKLRRLSTMGIMITIALLALVLIPGMGKTAGGASRWLTLGQFNLQPSEFAKLTTIIFTADILTQKHREITNLSHLLIPLVPIVIFIALLVVFQPDLGTAFAICLSIFILMFLAGARIHHIIGVGLVGCASTFLLIFSAGYRRQRFLSFLNPWSDPRGSGFHIIQSLLAFGSGGLRGVGLGLGRQKFFYLPASHTDFIFAVIGEELGLLGTLLVVALYSILAIIGLRISLKSRDRFGRLLGAGVTCMILIQALINMGAVTGAIPITGIPLPLISFGGSSLFFTLCSIGILLNIASQEPRKSGAKANASTHWRRRNRRAYLSRSRSGGRIKITGGRH
ncbi:MAG: putative lipid II flippase FtsW [Actinomycetota bacterium]